MQELFYAAEDGYKLRAVYFAAAAEESPLIVDIHGGGFIGGSADADAKLCERLASETGFNVASLEYRLAPAWKFPAAIRDCVAMIEGMRRDVSLKFDRTRVMLIGSSAGANAAVGAAWLSRVVSAMVLNYPWLNLACNRREYLPASITDEMMDGFVRMYCPERCLCKTPLATPLNMEAEDIRTLPPTLILTGGSDSLRVDGMAFYKMLQDGGIASRLIEYPKARHGFIEAVSAETIKVDEYTSEADVAAQTESYEKAIGDIAAFFKQSASAHVRR